MFLERYRRRRWIVGSVVVSIAVITMLLAPPPRVVHIFFNENVYETRRTTEGTTGSNNATDTTGSKEISFPLFKPASWTSTSAQPTPSMFTYVEEPPNGNEMKRLMRALSTQGAVCADVRRIGGLPQGPHGAPRPLGPDGMWYVCFDEEVMLLPGWCVVYSFGTGDDFSFDEKMANYGCKVFAFDPSMGKEDHNHSAGVMFYNLGLSNVNQEAAKDALSSDPLDKSTWKTRTLAAIIEELGHAQREVDILKMDIESDEWKCLRHMLAEGTLRKYVRQLDVEYHVIEREALRQYYSIAKWLERQGFRIFHSRRNPYCQECWEMSYINSNLVNLPLN
ncbi:putative methyltransferase-like protein 24 isoform X2 [Oculina patagonica]